MTGGWIKLGDHDWLNLTIGSLPGFEPKGLEVVYYNMNEKKPGPWDLAESISGT